jgi:DnaJ like chaperone protein
MLTLIGALIGAIAGGFKGFLVGGAVGYLAGRLLRQTLLGGLRVAQSQLIDSTFSVMGALCKADSVVTRDEIRIAERTFDMLNLQGALRQQARDAFNAGKGADFDIDAAVDQFAKLSRRRAPLINLFLQLQTMAVAADGVIHPAEHAMLVRIARRLGLDEHDVARLEALLRSGGPDTSYSAGPAPKQRLDDAYAALGVGADASDADVKRAYRKLISENHPDKLAARGLPESMRAVAEERSRTINKAYDLIKEARGII